MDAKRPKLVVDNLNSRPKLSQLQNIMWQEDGVITSWHTIGLLLLDNHSRPLSVIKKNHPNDAEECCIEMFSYWLKSRSNASWKQLIEALIGTGLNTAASNIQLVDNGVPVDVNYIERQLKARTLTTLRGRYARVIERLRDIIEDKNVDIKSAILKLCSLDDKNITIFSTDEAFLKIQSTTDLFHHIGQYCSIYDYELLEAFLDSTECKEAIGVLDSFTKELCSSILNELNLFTNKEELQNSISGHKLEIKYDGEECTMKIEKIIRKVISETFCLRKGSIIFIGVQKGCVALVYQISAAVKSHLQQYPITDEDFMLFSKAYKIKCLLIDDEELQVIPEKIDFTVVLTGATGNGKSAACNFFIQRKIFKSEPSFLSVTSRVASGVATIGGKYIELVDTPGLLDPCSMNKDNERLEFAQGLIKLKSGFHVLGLVFNMTKRIEILENKLLEDLLCRYQHYLPYVVLIFTHGKRLGDTDDKQKDALKKMIDEVKESKTVRLYEVLQNIEHRYIIMESIELMEEPYYHAKKSKELVKMIETVFMQTGKAVTNDFALGIAENLQKVKIDTKELEEELADRIKTAQELIKEDESAPTEEKNHNFFSYLKIAIITGGGILASLLPKGVSAVLKGSIPTADKCIFQ